MHAATAHRGAMSSPLPIDDLIHWTIVKDLINYSHLSSDFTAFQYPTAFIEGDKLIVVSRTAFNKCANFHDSNYITFHEFSI